ncbi:DUF4238 domain-containing protein [Salmonirosea aquatica]|uniref:DUF4238 domain-containing protein n=1 Tax=Salmonirosea aquatica TaxID=2654236 RepID=A0A7C9BEE6_9BACT|nr:DUF4238 domain-containing protein [Cytophagaceae bacterium SJW1-29]
MNNLSERHHYIPKFYAKGFLDEDKKFYVYDKYKDEVKKKKTSPKEIFYEWNRNTISSRSGSIDLIEDYYGFLDSDCAEVIRNLREKPNEDGIQTDETIALLRFFIISLFWRVPKSDFAAIDYFSRAKTTFIDTETGEIVDKTELEKKIKSDPNYLKFLRPNFSLEIIKNVAISNKSSSTSQLFGFNKDIFLTGDYPILFRKMPSQVDELLNGDYILPISSKRIYRITKKKIEMTFSLENAIDFNALLIEQSKFYVCGPDRDFLEKCIRYWKAVKSNGILWNLPNSLFKSYLDRY